MIALLQHPLLAMQTDMANNPKDFEVLPHLPFYISDDMYRRLDDLPDGEPVTQGIVSCSESPWLACLCAIPKLRFGVAVIVGQHNGEFLSQIHLWPNIRFQNHDRTYPWIGTNGSGPRFARPAQEFWDGLYEDNTPVRVTLDDRYMNELVGHCESQGIDDLAVRTLDTTPAWMRWLTGASVSSFR